MEVNHYFASYRSCSQRGNKQVEEMDDDAFLNKVFDEFEDNNMCSNAFESVHIVIDIIREIISSVSAED